MGHLTTDEKIREFFKVYSANFGKLKEDDGVSAYEDWLKSPYVDIDIAIRVIGRLAENQESKAKPRLGKIKKAVREASPARAKRGTNEDCNRCKGTGSVNAVTAGNSPDTQRYVNRPKNYPYKTNRLFPCICEKAKEFYYRQDPKFQNMYSLGDIETMHELNYCFYTSTELWAFFEECNKCEKAPERPGQKTIDIQTLEVTGEVAF